MKLDEAKTHASYWFYEPFPKIQEGNLPTTFISQLALKTQYMNPNVVKRKDRKKYSQFVCSHLSKLNRDGMQFIFNRKKIHPYQTHLITYLNELEKMNVQCNNKPFEKCRSCKDTQLPFSIKDTKICKC